MPIKVIHSGGGEALAAAGEGAVAALDAYLTTEERMAEAKQRAEGWEMQKAQHTQRMRAGAVDIAGAEQRQQFAAETQPLKVAGIEQGVERGALDIEGAQVGNEARQFALDEAKRSGVEREQRGEFGAEAFGSMVDRLSELSPAERQTLKDLAGSGDQGRKAAASLLDQLRSQTQHTQMVEDTMGYLDELLQGGVLADDPIAAQAMGEAYAGRAAVDPIGTMEELNRLHRQHLSRQQEVQRRTDYAATMAEMVSPHLQSQGYAGAAANALTVALQRYVNVDFNGAAAVTDEQINDLFVRMQWMGRNVPGEGDTPEQAMLMQAANEAVMGQGIMGGMDPGAAAKWMYDQSQKTATQTREEDLDELKFWVTGEKGKDEDQAVSVPATSHGHGETYDPNNPDHANRMRAFVMQAYGYLGYKTGTTKRSEIEKANALAIEWASTHGGWQFNAPE